MSNNTSPTYLVILYYPESKYIDNDDILILIEQLDNIKESNIKCMEVMLNSAGGDAYSAYKMIKILRSKCEFLRVIVPLYAKSAATLLSLGADEIIMGPQSELGPLDAQIEHPHAEGILLSALDGVNPLRYLSIFASDLAFEFGSQIRDKVGLSRKDSVELSIEFTDKIITPIISKLDPLLINMCYRNLLVAEYYGKELLTKYMFKNNNPETEEVPNADDTINQLVWQYPEHGFVIDIDEAKRLNLKVKNAKEYNDWEFIWNIFLALQEYEDKVILVDNKETLTQTINRQNGVISNDEEHNDEEHN